VVGGGPIGGCGPPRVGCGGGRGGGGGGGGGAVGLLVEANDM
jgi:hypothetical protein